MSARVVYVIVQDHVKYYFPCFCDNQGRFYEVDNYCTNIAELKGILTSMEATKLEFKKGILDSELKARIMSRINDKDI